MIRLVICRFVVALFVAGPVAVLIVGSLAWLDPDESSFLAEFLKIVVLHYFSVPVVLAAILVPFHQDLSTRWNVWASTTRTLASVGTGAIVGGALGLTYAFALREWSVGVFLAGILTGIIYGIFAAHLQPSQGILVGGS